MSGEDVMRVSQTNGIERSNGVTDLHDGLLEFACSTNAWLTPGEVLDALHRATTSTSPHLSVLGAARFPLKVKDWGAIRLGKSIFLHKDVPDGWWEEYVTLAPTRFTPTLFLARSSLASYTWTETKRMLEPIGVDRWCDELALKYGMRDGFTCPVGGRWVVAFWSKRVLCNILTPASRILLQTASSFAAQRLEHLAGADVRRVGVHLRLTPRELAVLRLVSTGRQAGEIAKALGLGEETVRSHLKKAQVKLGASNRAHAACEALRQNLIP
jgi:LuxR family quorum sensing-dependent transcriptional regulator